MKFEWEEFNEDRWHLYLNEEILVGGVVLEIDYSDDPPIILQKGEWVDYVSGTTHRNRRRGNGTLEEAKAACEASVKQSIIELAEGLK